MIVFRNSGLAPLSAGLVVLLFSMAGAGDVYAQAPSGPTRLLPRPEQPVTPTETPPRGWVDETVQIKPLSAVDFSAAGLIDEQSGGFPVTLWRGTDREVLIPLIAHIQPTLSPTLQSLTRRLLASTAEPPMGPQNVQPGLLSVRATTLMALGLTTDGLALATLNHAPPDAELTRSLIETKFLLGNYSDACDLITTALTQDGNVEWLKANAFCRAKGGDVSGAEISAELLRDQKIDDAGFYSLLAALTNSSAKLEGVDGKSALHIAMLRAAQRPLLPDMLSNATPNGLRAMAEAPGPAALTLGAAERACAYGAIMPEDLRNAYTSIRFDTAELSNAKTSAPGFRDSRGNALLYQAALIQSTAAQRAEMLSLALKNAVALGMPITLVGRTLSDQVRNIPPTPDLAWFAPDALRMLLAANQEIDAHRWYAMLVQQRAGGKVEPMQDPAIAASLMQIADIDSPGQIDDWLAEWYGAMTLGSAPETRDRRATLLLSILEALGYTVPSDLWQKLYTSNASALPGNEAPAPILRGLRAAASEKKLGETVIFALLALGPDGPGKANANTLATVITSLRTVGLVAEARRLALEAVLVRGF